MQLYLTRIQRVERKVCAKNTQWWVPWPPLPEPSMITGSSDVGRKSKKTKICKVCLPIYMHLSCKFHILYLAKSTSSWVWALVLFPLTDANLIKGLTSSWMEYTFHVWRHCTHTTILDKVVKGFCLISSCILIVSLLPLKVFYSVVSLFSIDISILL